MPKRSETFGTGPISVGIALQESLKLLIRMEEEEKTLAASVPDRAQNLGGSPGRLY
jgi:hypothetical protein